MVKAEKLTADARLKTLIDNGVKLGHRELLVMVIHHLISKSSGERPSILWCHKKDSDVPRQSRKHLKKLEKNLKSGKCDISKENAFDLFLLSTPVRYCPLSDTQRILGNTYGMCVIQDFEGLTPNTLCRVVETVAGGGAVIFLMSCMQSMRQLFTLSMDVHSKLKTHSHPCVTPLFNERFVLSLGWCKSCLILNDQLQVVPELPSLSGPVHPVGPTRLEEVEASQGALSDLQKSLEDGDKPLPQLVGCCKTLDQAKAVLKMIDVITEKGGRATVSVTAGRGRGKSAALGLAVAAAVHFGLNNIFVTSPSPNNLGTFFEFLLKGFDVLGYEEQSDYEIIQSTNVDFNEAVVCVNIFREYRQTIQYLDPADSEKLTQAELLVIDEAAAIPLSYVKSLIGSCNVIMASTVNGYEGTGRSLSLKLLQQLRKQTGLSGAASATSTVVESSVNSSRTLHEVTLEESVRYNGGDPVETWLHQLLCLDATSTLSHNTTCPPPQNCQLYYVNRNVLLCGHRESEEFLQQVVSLLVASHYRNSPDDLQVLSDAPAHHLFVLLPPIVSGMKALPTVLAVIQVCLEGGIPASVSNACKSRGERPSGDLVPWSLASQFLDVNLTKLTGARIIRVATHPDYQSMGYGSRAINLLSDYYKGKHITLDDEQNSKPSAVEANQAGEVIVPRKTDEPLLSKLGERVPEHLDYLSVSYGVTLPLLKFWCRAEYIPLYISQVVNKVTGEHNCVMVQPLDGGEDVGDNNNMTIRRSSWVKRPSEEFLRRFLSLLGGPLSDLSPMLALRVIQAHVNTVTTNEIEWRELKTVISGHDLQRLEKYSKNLADRHLITDLLPSIARLFFMKKLPAVHLSPLQSSLLVGLGLQLKSFDDVTKPLDLPIESALGQFNRAMRRLLKVMCTVQETALARHLPKSTATLAEFTPVSISLDQDLEDAAKDYDAEAEKKDKNQPVGSKLLGDIRRFAVQGNETAWEAALQEGPGSIISVKSTKRPAKMTEQELELELERPSKKKKDKTGKSTREMKPSKKNW
ncbi:RNA cytidine acetyltransferase-like 2 [Homarus americanus]|uniref:RNA cytidine acetyltransferase n=1 Tax=Homarus americanus TaxID=6706 RepID=A0A8J5N7U1_HOMAM|nr:RNA cytidine acetyltransferase-like 2 [Homarus americanus]